jgi:hypothetical protein
MATLQDYYNQLAPIYEPQIASLKAQEAGLAPQYQAQKSALEQARVNAFRNISNTASSRGMAFSGFTPEMEAQYTGTTFLPAMANLETQQLKGKQSLIDAINAANAERYAKAMGLSESAQQAEAANAAKIEAARIKAANTVAPTPKAPTTNELLQSLMEDAQGFFHGRNFNPNGMLQNGTTEKKIIPELQMLYPELSLKQIKEKVYAVRKQMYGV